MSEWQRTSGQILLAVGGALALGGIATFLFPNANIELRGLTGIVSTMQGRLVWLAISVTIAAVGLWLLRRAKRSRP